MAAAPDFPARTMLASPLTVVAGGNERSLLRPGVFTVPYVDGFELNHTVSKLCHPSSPDPARRSAKYRKGRR